MAIPYNFNPLGFSGKGKAPGTADNPYLIWTAEDFRVFRNAITAGTTFEGIYHKLMANIDLTGITFTVSSSIDDYMGNFDGNFKIISNFTRSNFNTYSGGLFRYTFGHIHSLGLENIDIDNRTGLLNNGNGGISGNNYGTIEKCFVTGTFLAANARTGGIAGYCGTTSIITNCWTNVVITGDGARYGGISGTGGGTVMNCYALGNISSTNTYVGGICGDTSATKITGCVAGMERLNSEREAYRIKGYGTMTALRLYGLDSMLVKGVTVSGTSTSVNGADTTITQLKSLAFYRDTVLWDMDNTWVIDEGNDFPKLRGFPYTPVMTNESTYVEAVFLIPSDNYTITESNFRVVCGTGSTVVIDWGDGTIFEKKNTNTSDALIGFTKVYTSAGRYTVKIYEADYGHTVSQLWFNGNVCIESINRLQGIGITHLNSLCANNGGSVFKEFNADFSLVPNVLSLTYAFLRCYHLRTPLPSLAPLTKLDNLIGAWNGCSNMPGQALPVIASLPVSVRHNFTFKDCTSLSDYNLIPDSWKSY